VRLFSYKEGLLKQEKRTDRTVYIFLSICTISVMITLAKLLLFVALSSLCTLSATAPAPHPMENSGIYNGWGQHPQQTSPHSSHSQAGIHADMRGEHHSATDYTRGPHYDQVSYGQHSGEPDVHYRTTHYQSRQQHHGDTPRNRDFTQGPSHQRAKEPFHHYSHLYPKHSPSEGINVNTGYGLDDIFLASFAPSSSLGHLTLDEMYEHTRGDPALHDEQYLMNDENEPYLYADYSRAQYPHEEDHGNAMEQPDANVEHAAPPKTRAPRVVNEYYKFLQLTSQLAPLLDILEEKSPSFTRNIIQRHCCKLIDEKIAKQIQSGDEESIKEAKKALKLTNSSAWMEGFKKAESSNVLNRMERALNMRRRYIGEVMRVKKAPVEQVKEIEAAGSDAAIRALSLKYFNMGQLHYDELLANITHV
jgi:hypothetical protein